MYVCLCVCEWVGGACAREGERKVNADRVEDEFVGNM